MVDIFEEVEEELRADRWTNIVRKALPWVGAAAAAAVIGVGGVWGWQAWQTSKTNTASEAFAEGTKALESGDKTKALEHFKTASEAGAPAYRALALMELGAAKISDKQNAEAVKLFDEAAKASKAPLISDAAALKSAFALMDTAPYADIEKRLTPLTEEGRPYRMLAREALAMAKIQAGKFKEARADFSIIATSLDSPEGLKARAQAGMLAIDSGAAAQAAGLAKAAAALPERPAAPQGMDPAMLQQMLNGAQQ